MYVGGGQACYVRGTYRLLQALETEKRAGERNGVITSAMQESTLDSALSIAYTLSPANSLPTIIHNSGTSTYAPAQYHLKKHQQESVRHDHASCQQP